MRKKDTARLFLLAAVSAALPSGVLAQDVPAGSPSLSGSIAQQTPPPTEWKGSFVYHEPLVAESSPTSKTTTTQRPTVRKAYSVKNKEIWVNKIAGRGMTSSQRGLYRFYTVDPGTSEALGATNSTYSFGYGSGIQDSIYYVVGYSNGSVRLTGFSIKTWQPVINAEPLSGFSMMAVETAQTKDGTIYGQFFNDDRSNIEYGIVDYAKRNRTTIGVANHQMAVLGVTNDKRLYGIGTDGYLYSINTSNGNETQIGYTGVPVARTNGNFYSQTAEIDQSDNTFYWIAKDSVANGSFRTVDLATGASTVLYTYTNNEQYVGMIIPPASIADNAPGAPTNVATKFENGSLSGYVTFTAPAISFQGDTLSGSLQYTVTNDSNVVLATGTCQAGDSVSAPVTSQQGQQTFIVTASNAAGTSPAAKTSTWVGYDVPGVPRGPRLTIDSETREANVTWSAPTSTSHRGYLGPLTYDVWRVAGTDTTQVANKQSEVQFSETLPEGPLTFYKYLISAHNGNQESNQSSTSFVALGTAYAVPYSEDFDISQAWNLYTVINANNDNQRWSRSTLGGSHVYYNQSSTENADDWFVSPPVTLKAGHSYNVTIEARNMSTNRVNTFEVKIGKGTTVDALTQTAVPSTEVTETRYTRYTTDSVVVAQDGDYNFGVHLTSAPSQGSIYIDLFEITEGANLLAPDSVTDLTVVPDSKAALKANISFKAPTKLFNGSALTSPLTKIDVLRNDTVVKSLTNVQPGAAVTVTDDSVSHGNNTYSVIAYNAEGAGRPSREVTTYIGLDIPAPLTQLTYDDRMVGSLGMNWNKVSTKGAHDGVVDPATTDYLLWTTTQRSGVLFLDQKLDSIHADTTATVNFNTEEGDQQLAYFAVQPVNAAGEGGAFSTELMIGKTYTLPFTEHLNGTAAEHYWIYDPSSTAVHFYWNAESSDGTGHSFRLQSTEAGEQGAVASGKISLAGAKKPTLLFDAYSSSTVNPLSLIVLKADGTQDIIPLEKPDSTFKTYSVDLSKYATQRYVRVKMFGQFIEAGYYNFDNIHITDYLDTNLGIAISATDSVAAGQPANIQLKVSNTGRNAVNAYNVTLSDGTNTNTVSIDSPLASLSDTTITVPFAPSIFTEAGTRTLTATVSAAGDENADDNTATAEITITEPTAAPPTNVKGETTAKGVDITWNAPTEGSSRITDDFSSYTPWTVDSFTPWTTRNADEGYAGSLFSNLTLPHQGEQYAYVLSDFNANGYNAGSTFPGHSGTAYLTAFYGTNKGATAYEDAHDWLISPELSGKAQKVDFWVISRRGATRQYAETFNVYYSTTDTATTSFVQIGETQTTESGEWEHVTVNIPEGAKYFAIEHNTKAGNAYWFGIDDISYSIAATPSSYAIYANKQQVGKVDANTHSYSYSGTATDALAVSAIYPDGSESRAVPVEVTTGINSITVADGTFAPANVYTVDGKLVRRDATSLSGLSEGVYIIDGKKVVVK